MSNSIVFLFSLQRLPGVLCPIWKLCSMPAPQFLSCNFIYSGSLYIWCLSLLVLLLCFNGIHPLIQCCTEWGPQTIPDPQTIIIHDNIRTEINRGHLKAFIIIWYCYSIHTFDPAVDQFRYHWTSMVRHIIDRCSRTASHRVIFQG